MEDFEKALKCVRNFQNYTLNWSVWEHEKIHSGDRFFMLRVDKGNDGIVMSGRIVSEPYQEKDWSGKSRKIHYVDIVPDFLIDSNCKPRLRIADLEKYMPKYTWKEGHSGMVLDDSYRPMLEWLWAFYNNRYFLESLKIDFAHKKGEIKFKVTSKNSIFKNLVATLRAGSSFKVANTESIRHFSFLPSLGLTQIFLTKAIFRGDLKFPLKIELYRNLYHPIPDSQNVKSVRNLLHCICENCRNF